jgi:hypothetical protein
MVIVDGSMVMDPVDLDVGRGALVISEEGLEREVTVKERVGVEIGD